MTISSGHFQYPDGENQLRSPIERVQEEVSYDVSVPTFVNLLYNLSDNLPDFKKILTAKLWSNFL